MEKFLLIPNNPKKLLITHSTKLAEARYNLTVGEQRLVLLMISMIEPNDEDFKDYEIKVLDFLDLLNLTGKANYKRVQNITESLVCKIVKIREDNSLLQTSWLSSAKYLYDEGTVKLSFDPKLKPYLLQLKSHFTKYHLSTVIQFRSIYTIRIYTLLKAYQYIGFVDFYYQDLRIILGIGEDEYKDFRDFRKRVIVQSRKELEEKTPCGNFKSDLSFNMEILERKNRKIHKMRLNIIEYDCKEPLFFPVEKQETAEPQNLIIEKLVFYGVTPKQASELFSLHRETINASIDLFESDLNKNKVTKNKTGYLVKLVKIGAGGKSSYEKEQEEQKKERAEHAQKIKLETEKKEQEKKTMQGERNQKVQHIFDTLSLEEKETIEQELKDGLNEVESRFYKKSGLNHPAIKHKLSKIIEKYYL